MLDVTLVHDYLLQVGGAERVVAHWAAGFDARTVHTLAYRPEGTFDGFRRLDVRTSIPHGLAPHVERMLPALPAIADRTRVTGGDVALVSSSGWAHRFQYDMPHVVYVHSPARWLYATNDYRLRLSPLRRAGLRASTPLLRRGDAEAMLRAPSVIANSIVTRDRLYDAYSIDVEVVNPPVEPVSDVAQAPARELPDEFAIVVARDRGYKGIALAVAAARRAGMPIVVVGAGSESFDEPESGVYGVGSATDAELCWLYRRAAVVVGAGHEDFGLTILEAALEGTPAATVAAGGYLETVRSGVNGLHAASDTPEGLATAMRGAREIDAGSCREWGRAFGRDTHIARIASVLEEVMQRA